MGQINRVLIAGGTHGNELIGIYLIQQFQQHPARVQRPSFQTVSLLGNPRAIAAGVRHVDRDLNRCFNFEAMPPELLNSAAYEIQRAQEISRQFGPRGEAPVDLCIDTHSTTSNAGIMLILDSVDAFTLSLAAHLSRLRPGVNLYSSTTSGRKQDSLRSLATHRICIEVGPVAHGTLHAQLFQATAELVQAALDFTERYRHAAPSPPATTVYQYLDAVDFPRDPQGRITAMVHPQRQFRDYQPLHPGDPLFLTFGGETLAYSGSATVYPVFINEAAYYEKGIAMYLTEKQRLTPDP